MPIRREHQIRLANSLLTIRSNKIHANFVPPRSHLKNFKHCFQPSDSLREYLLSGSLRIALQYVHHGNPICA